MTVSAERSAMSTVKLALLASQVRAQLADGDALAAEPIAVIGIGCRFPGGANSPDALWAILRDGVDAITEIPADRWDIDEFYDPDPYAPGTMNSRYGGFIDDIDQFDAAFFGISPREAARMDPQQRMLLEVAVEALERAGQPLDALAGSLTGVFVASSLLDYSTFEHADVMDVEAYSLTGNVHCIIPNRLSYTFDLRGPSVSVDTACSSSLVAVHMACQSLRNRDSDLVLAGGVNALLSPEMSVSLAKWGLMAPDGHCKTFDASADGFVRSEGCGVVVLKRLADALADNDPVLAVIRGSAVNQDGRSTAMTAPNGLAQQDVIRRALQNGQVLAEQVGCVELHGTGTVLGDPIEVEAIAEVLGAPGAGAPPVALTAVKTNIGHLEAASGVAGLIKTVLCLQHGQIPAPLHFRELNPHILLDGTRLFIPAALHDWPAGDVRRIAGVSSFGFGGTNAHVVVEEAPRLPSATAVDGPPLFVLSAQTAEGLRDLAAATADQLAKDGVSDSDVADMAATAALRRVHHDERLSVVGSTAVDLVERLRAAAAGQSRLGIARGRREPGAPRRIAFVCSGQGNQWFGMARDLLAESDVFRSVVTDCDALLRAHVSWSLLDELSRPEDESRLERTEIAQPAIFAIQVGLAAVWRGWGITPDAVVGHSIGEVAAAHLAGALDLADAVRVVATRGASMRDAHGAGTMASVELPVAAVDALIAPFGDRLSIAAVNAPDVTVVSGDADAVAELVALVQASGAVVKTLAVPYPFHSRSMAVHGQALTASLAGLTPRATHTRLVSTVTGAVVDGKLGDDLDASYWGRNVVERVRFSDAIGVLAASGCDTFVELGPQPVLGGAIARTLAALSAADGALEPVIVASLRRGRHDLESLAISLGELHCSGVTVDWKAVWPGRRPMAPLPTTAWQRRRHWVDAAPRSSARAVAARPRPGEVGHPLVGARLRSAAIEGWVFESRLTPNAPAFLDDHRIGDVVLMPGTGFIEIALAAFTAATGNPATTLNDLDIVGALALADDGEATTVQVHLRGDATNATFSITSTVDGEMWVEHARGRLGVEPGAADTVPISDAQARCETRLAGADLYRRIGERGINFGSSFRGIDEMWTGTAEALGRIVPPTAVAASMAPYRFHPALLDAAIHPVVALLAGDDTAFLPIAMRSLHLHRSPTGEMWTHLRLRSDPADDIVTVDIAVAGSDGEPIADLLGLRVVRATAASLHARIGRTPRAANGSAPASEHLYALDWRPASVPTAVSLPAGPWLVVGDGAGVGSGIAEQLRASGAECIVVPPGDALDRHSICALAQSNGVREVLYLRGLDTSALRSGADPVLGQQRGLGGALSVVQGLLDAPARLWLVTRGAQAVAGSDVAPEQAPLSGLGATIRTERPDIACVRIDLDPSEPMASNATSVLAAIAACGDEELIAIRGSERLAARLVPIPATAPPVAGPTRLASTTYGVLDGLRTEPMQRRHPGPGEVEIEVVFTGLNFRDVLVALDLYPQRSTVFGDECAGFVVAVGDGVESVRPGDRVVALAPGSFATHVTTDADLVFAIPHDLDLADAATIPIPFLTAEYALVALGHLRAGERVLVHAGAGGVGMAAIQICQRIGAVVFATAGSPEKRATLAALGVEHIFDSRSLDFAEGILSATAGEGVHVVLNSLAGEFIQRSVDVLATDGRFLEIGRRDVWTHEQMSTARPDVDYDIVFLGDLSIGDPPSIQAMFVEMMPRFAAGELTPLPRTTFDSDAVVDAFRFMAQARHTGKIVVRQRRASLSASGTHLVTGGLGGVGLRVAHHLVERGARHVALTGRSATGRGDSAASAIAAMRDLGADVRTFAADIADRDDVERLIKDVESDMPAVCSVVHAAGVVADALLGDMTWAHVESVLAPKLAGAWNLHDVLADRELEMFVLMSAASPVLGSPGQANYVAANAFLDAFAAWRHNGGQRGLSIGWGAWDRVGMTERTDRNDADRLARHGLLSLSTDDALAAFDAAGRAESNDVAHVLAIALDRDALDDRPVLSGLRAAAPVAESSGLLQQWIDTVAGMRRTVIAAFVDAQAKLVLGLPAASAIPARQPLNEIGLDSLMAVELRNAIGGALGAPQPATLLFDHPTSASLVDHLVAVVEASAGPSAPAPDDGRAAPGPVATTDLAMLADLSDDEAEAMLLAELRSTDGEA